MISINFYANTKFEHECQPRTSDSIFFKVAMKIRSPIITNAIYTFSPLVEASLSSQEIYEIESKRTKTS